MNDAGEASGRRRAADRQAGRTGGGPPSSEPQFRVRPVVRPPRRDEDERRVASRDETDTGWSEPPDDRDAEWYRRQRPPHHE